MAALASVSGGRGIGRGFEVWTALAAKVYKGRGVADNANVNPTLACAAIAFAYFLICQGSCIASTAAWHGMGTGHTYHVMDHHELPGMTNLNANPRWFFIGIERVRQVNIAYTEVLHRYPRFNILCIYQQRGPIAVSIYQFHLPGQIGLALDL